MFCIYCGKDIPDGTECDCRRQAASDNLPNPTDPESISKRSAYSDFNYYTPQESQYGYGNANRQFSSESARLPENQGVLKEVFGSPLMLVMSILFSLQVVLEIITSFNFDIFSILTAVGMWLIYASARKADAPFKTGGLTIHSVVLMISRVFWIMLYVLIMILLTILSLIPSQLNAFLDELNTYMSINYDTTTAIGFSTTVFIILMVVWTCVFVFVLFYNIKLRNSTIALKNNAQNIPSKHGVSIFPAIVFIIQAVGSVGSAISYVATASIRNEFLSALMNNLIEQLEDMTDTQFNFSYSFATNYVYVIQYLVSAGAMVIAALITFKLRSKLNNNSKNNQF